jgi:hypothetical protein
MAREVLKRIDVDPASSYEANKTVGASRIITKEQNGLSTEWGPGTVFLNPPGGRCGSRSLAEAFWDRLVRHSEDERGFLGAVFIGFSIEALATTQRSRRPILSYPICVPRRRIAFVPGFSGPGAAEKKSPSHANVIAYIPGREDRTDQFAATFGTIGFVKV